MSMYATSSENPPENVQGDAPAIDAQVSDDTLADALSANVVGPDPAEQAPAAATDPDPGATSTMEAGTYVPDIAKLASSGGDPEVWAHELYQLIGNTTGKFIAEETLASWMRELTRQSTEAALRTALFQVANTALPASVKGDPALLMLQLRDDIASGFRYGAGLTR